MLGLLCLFAAGATVAQGPPPMSAAEKDADALFRASNWAEAAPAYEAVATAEPANGRAHYRLGVAYSSLKQYEKAAGAFRGALQLKFAPVLGNYNLACALARLQRTEEAFAALNASVQAGFTNLAQLQSDEDLASLRGDARFATLVSAIQHATRPCEFDPAYRQFDFWVGEWEVTPVGAPPNTPRPQSRIEKILNGCVILENWMPPNAAGGKSFNSYNAQTRKWEQFWVDSVGTVIHFIGEARDGNMYYTAESTAPSGAKTLGKMTFFNLGPDRVRQLWEQSTDGGKTWSVAFDGMYNRKK
jgi:tetratricopeptide (TPR) repeat protein